MNEKMKSKILAVVALGLLTGCAQKMFVHSYKGNYDFERDKYDCQMDASQYAANWGDAGNPFMIVDQMEKCLKIKHGWKLQSK